MPEPPRRGPPIGRRDFWLRHSHGQPNRRPVKQGHRRCQGRAAARGSKRTTARANQHTSGSPASPIYRQPHTNQHGSSRRGERRRGAGRTKVGGPRAHGELFAVHGDDAPDHSHVKVQSSCGRRRDRREIGIDQHVPFWRCQLPEAVRHDVLGRLSGEAGGHPGHVDGGRTLSV